MPTADDDDDDLFDNDELFLDERTIAALDETEAKLCGKRQQDALTQDVVPPPAKRPRLDYQQSVSEYLNTFDSLPEIIVTGNGRYGIPQGDPTAFHRSGHSTPGTSTKPLSQPQHIQTRPSTLKPTQNASNAPSRPPPPRNTTPAPTCLSTHTPTPPPQSGMDQAAILRRLKELQEANAKMEQAMKASKSVEYAKTGEVTILRTNLEKTKREHAKKLADITAEVNEQKAKIAQMALEMKDEREKMQTQLAFKNQEQEAARLHKSQRVKDVQATPMRTGPLFSQHNSVAGPSTVKIRSTRKSPQKRAQKLIGFTNAFDTTSPLQARTKKGKRRATQQAASSPPPSSPSALFNDLPDISCDVDMVDVFAEPALPPQKESSMIPHQDDLHRDDLPVEVDIDTSVVDIPPYDWKAEMHQIILTYKHPSSARTALQQVVEASLPPEYEEEYQNVVGQLLIAMGNYQALHDYRAAASAIASSLITLTSILVRHDIVPQLLTIFGLLTHLIYSLPSFTSILLYTSDASEPTHSHFLVCICSLIPRHLHLPNDITACSTDLAKATIDLLCALCWNPERRKTERLAYMTHHRDVYAALLHGSQPAWMLERVTDFLILYISCPEVALNLLNICAIDPSSTDRSKFPVLDRLCSFLVDANRQNAEGMPLKRKILKFIALLSASHPQALKLLSQSQVLIPTFVTFLTMLITPLWEDEEAFSTSDDLAASTVRLLNQTVYLMHRLVFFEDPPLNIRNKLLRAPVRHFNGILHMFTLTFGRLSYSAPPDWMSESMSGEMTVISELATDLLECVVDGPDGESVWRAFQENEVDEEEMIEEEDNMMNASQESVEL